MKAEEYLKNGKVYMWEEDFAVIKSRNVCSDAFANIIDKNEITVIIDQTKYKQEDVIEIKKDFKLLTFDMVIPFEIVGFLAKVSKILADENISIFAVSAFSTDHLLVKKNYIDRVINSLENLGCILKKK